MVHDSLDSRIEKEIFSHSNKIVLGTMITIAGVYAVAAYGPEMYDLAQQAYASICREVEQIPYQAGFP